MKIMNRNLLRNQFTLDNVPDWGCPTCSKGILQISRDLFIKKESYNSRKYSHTKHGFCPYNVSYVYTCFLTCSNEKCKETVINTGHGCMDDVIVDEYWDDMADDLQFHHEIVDCYKPQYFQPNLKIISIPENCPKTVETSLDESFKLFFTSPSASANNIRIALEKLLNELKIRRFIVNKKKKRQLLTLHQRIEILPDKYSHFKEIILAIKWLGNAGSHSNDEITRDDVMDAYELIEHLLDQIYQPKDKRIESIAKKINRNKGPA
jgi:Domain of unknown function (DUF4145)